MWNKKLQFRYSENGGKKWNTSFSPEFVNENQLMETLKPHFDQWQMRILYELESTNEKPALSHMTQHQPMRSWYCVTWPIINQWWLSIHSWLCYWSWCWHPGQWTACVHLSVIVATKLFIVKVRKKQNLGNSESKD